MKVNVKFVKLNQNAHVPTQGSDLAAGHDLYACIPEDDCITIAPFSTTKVGTGLAIQPPHGYFGAIFARSGLATKQSLRPSNCVGVCDEDYTGEYIVALHNDSYVTRSVKNGDRIAQLVFLPYVNAEFQEVESLDVTDRGSDGFGSTGK
jgi:dUTP pyrophosphatase